jgi:hypothetical protein
MADYSHLVRVSVDTMKVEYVSQIMHLLLSKTTFLQFNHPLVVCQQSQNVTKMSNMFLICPTVYQDIVKENNNAFMQEWSKGGVHCSLKSSRSTRQAEGNHRELIVASMSGKGYFELFTHLESNLMIPRVEIQYREPLSLPQLIDELIKNWYRIHRLDSHCVEVSIVDAKAP